LDSWRDPNGAWVGFAVTTAWLIAFVLSAGAPLIGYVLNRRRSPPGRVALIVWLPALLIVGITTIGLTLSPP
jgi:hypothetical protein